MSEIGRTKRALLDRLEVALRDMYHNATPHHPYSMLEDNECGEYHEWFSEAASQEISYISEGLGLSRKEWAKEARKGFPHNERFFWLVQRITEWGKLYQWGRGGRTLAPYELVKTGGGSNFRVLDGDDFIDNNNEYLTDMVQVLEAFNTYVGQWCSAESIKGLWQAELEWRKENEVA
jgi:hypothetical protein